jgi:hypothetical protein
VRLLAVLLASLAAAASAPAAPAPARTFSVAETKRAFRAATGLRLVNYAAASTPDAVSLRTSPYRTLRFGTFQLFVLNPRKLERMRRTFTHGVKQDARGIHWVSDRAGGWIAVTVYRRNLLVAWFPIGGSRGIDASWAMLDRAVLRLGPRV